MATPASSLVASRDKVNEAFVAAVRELETPR